MSVNINEFGKIFNLKYNGPIMISIMPTFLIFGLVFFVIVFLLALVMIVGSIVFMMKNKVPRKIIKILDKYSK